MLSDNFGRGYIQLYIFTLTFPMNVFSFFLKKSVLYADLRMLDKLLLNELNKSFKNVFNQIYLY